MGWASRAIITAAIASKVTLAAKAAAINPHFTSFIGSHQCLPWTKIKSAKGPPESSMFASQSTDAQPKDSHETKRIVLIGGGHAHVQGMSCLTNQTLTVPFHVSETSTFNLCIL